MQAKLDQKLNVVSSCQSLPTRCIDLHLEATMRHSLVQGVRSENIPQLNWPRCTAARTDHKISLQILLVKGGDEFSQP